MANRVLTAIFLRSHCRSFTTGIFSHQVHKRNSVVKEAERAVGYPTSFLSLRWLLNDEIANIVMHLRRLIGTKHPLLETAKNILIKNEQPTYGLIILLVAKMAGLKSHFAEIECDRTADILHSQRVLAEVTEMIKTAYTIHNQLINISTTDLPSNDLLFGNKLALLSGDYILSTSFAELAKLKQFDVQEIMSSSLRDLVEADYIGKRGPQNQAIPSMPNSQQTDIEVPNEYGTQLIPLKNVLGNMKMEWTLRTILGGGTLLGKACQSSLIFGNHEKTAQEAAYRFGRDLAIAWQASLDKEVIMEDSFSLVAAPVMCHLEHNPEFYNTIEKMTSSGWNVDYDLIKKAVLSGPGIEQSLELQKKYTYKALKTLDLFQDSDSKRALISLVRSF